MARSIPWFVLSCSVLFASCTTLPDWLHTPGQGAAIDDEVAVFNFDWHLSGDPSVAPIQVFDNDRQTWLQFQPDQILPAVFEHTSRGERPLPFTRRGDYLVLDGVWQSLSFRGGNLSATASRQQPDSKPSDSLNTVQESADPDVTAQSADLDESVTKQSLAPSKPEVSSEVQALTASSFERRPFSEKPSFDLSYDDATLRHALQRWAKQADWTFAPEHWSVDVDIPVSAQAEFGDHFKPAVQNLLAATSLGEYPVQPCFYSNRVLRVVAASRACDRGASDPS